MYLEKLKLHNFRCYEKLEIDFNRQLTVLVGKMVVEKQLFWKQ